VSQDVACPFAPPEWPLAGLFSSAVSFSNATNAFSARSEQSEGGIELVAGQSRMQNLVPVSLKIGRLAAA
jgi:hypothetical protein